MKEFLADPSKFVVAAPVQEDTKPGDGGGETKAEEKKEESEEESDDDMGFGEFILYLVVLVWDSFPLSSWFCLILVYALMKNDGFFSQACVYCCHVCVEDASGGGGGGGGGVTKKSVLCNRLLINTKPLTSIRTDLGDSPTIGRFCSYDSHWLPWAVMMCCSRLSWSIVCYFLFFS